MFAQVIVIAFLNHSNTSSNTLNYDKTIKHEQKNQESK